MELSSPQKNVVVKTAFRVKVPFIKVCIATSVLQQHRNLSGDHDGFVNIRYGLNKFQKPGLLPCRFLPRLDIPI